MCLFVCVLCYFLFIYVFVCSCVVWCVFIWLVVCYYVSVLVCWFVGLRPDRGYVCLFDRLFVWVLDVVLVVCVFTCDHIGLSACWFVCLLGCLFVWWFVCGDCLVACLVVCVHV